MILDSKQVVRLYRRLAPFYDPMVVPLEWLGGRRHRERAVRSLQLSPGGVVLDLGCGTGTEHTAGFTTPWVLAAASSASIYPPRCCPEHGVGPSATASRTSS